MTYSCIDTANGNSVVASGTGPSITLPFPPTTGTSPAVACTFTNVPLAATPGITVAKTATPTSFDRPGTTITYSFAVTNTGNVTLSAVQVTDTGLPGLSAISCPSGTLAPAARETCGATYSVTQADVDRGSVSNTAIAEGTPPGSKTPYDSSPSAATVRAVQAPSISLVKSASTVVYSSAGQTIGYRFLVTKTGDVTLSKVGITDALAGLSAISCPRPSLAPDASETCAASYVITNADVSAGQVVNTATAHATPEGARHPVVSGESSVIVFYDEPTGVPVTG